MFRIVLMALVVCLLLGACREEQYIYEVDEVIVLPNNAGKTKEKSVEQFINIAYANLYQTALSPSALVDATNVVASIGDKRVAFETLIAKMMNDPAVVLPSEENMRADLPAFIDATYERFFVRKPTEAERTWWVNYLETHPTLTPEHVYFTFATSNEYYYY